MDNIAPFIAFCSQVSGTEMYSTLRPEGLASGSAKASVAMEANKIRADFMTTVAIWRVFSWFFEKMATSSWFLEAGICLEWRTQVELGKRTLLSFSNKSSHELTVRNVQSYQIKVSLNYEKKPNCFHKCHFIHKYHRIEVITLFALNVLIHVAAGVRLTWKLGTLNWHAIQLTGPLHSLKYTSSYVISSIDMYCSAQGALGSGGLRNF